MERTDLDSSITSKMSFSEIRLKEYYQPISLFAKCEVELDCIDCHTHLEIMGDGDIYGHKSDAVEIECRTCHGTTEEKPHSSPAAKDSPVLLLAEANDNLDNRADELYVVSKRGNLLDNVKRVNNDYILIGKVTGQRWTVPIIYGSRCEQKPDEQQPPHCWECHDFSAKNSKYRG